MDRDTLKVFFHGPGSTDNEYGHGYMWKVAYRGENSPRRQYILAQGVETTRAEMYRAAKRFLEDLYFDAENISKQLDAKAKTAAQ